MTDLYHLGLTAEMLEGATLAIVPGDPARVGRIAARLDDPRPLASEREFVSALGRIDGAAIVVCSTGIGGPSTSIAIEELAQLGITTFLRSGTAGAIAADLAIGTVVVTTGSVRLDGASRDFAPIEFPAVADHQVTSALVDAARRIGAPVRTGVTASTDTFYPGQERYDTVSGRVLPRLRGSRDEWEALGVLNYEMESATLLTMCAVNGWRAGCAAGVLVNRHLTEHPDHAVAAAVDETTISVVIEAARILLGEDRTGPGGPTTS